MTLMRRPQGRTQVPLRSVLERLAGEWPGAIDGGGVADLVPALDVRETDDAYVVEVDLPGIDPEQTEVLVEGRTVTIRGMLAEEREEPRGNYLVRERRQGTFLRAVALPGMIEVDQVETRYQNGQLTITLPKASSSRARRIAIGGGADKSEGERAGGTTESGRMTQASSSAEGSRGSTASSRSGPSGSGASRSASSGAGEGASGTGAGTESQGRESAGRQTQGSQAGGSQAGGSQAGGSQAGGSQAGGSQGRQTAESGSTGQPRRTTSG
jgi:HSP20 family protein